MHNNLVATIRCYYPGLLNGHVFQTPYTGPIEGQRSVEKQRTIKVHASGRNSAMLRNRWHASCFPLYFLPTFCADRAI